MGLQSRTGPPLALEDKLKAESGNGLRDFQSLHFRFPLSEFQLFFPTLPYLLPHDRPERAFNLVDPQNHGKLPP